MGFIRRKLSNFIIGKFADKGPLPGRYSAGGDGTADLHEILDKKHFALEVPRPSPDYINSLPDLAEVQALFQRPVGTPAPKSRASLLLPFVAQHLTDAVFQSKPGYATDASHEIILNQVYGNTADDTAMLRASAGGKMKTQVCMLNGSQSEFPPALCEQVDGSWLVKPEFSGLSYLQTPGNEQKLRDKYIGKEDKLCAVGLIQGNLTVGNFALTTILLREHNRLADGIAAELGFTDDTSKEANDTIFRIAQQNNIVGYMKIVIEDYINTFAGRRLFEMDIKKFFYEAKRWCRESPIPYHFNALYRIHSMIPDTLVVGGADLGFAGFLANNDVVMAEGLGEVFQSASAQAASEIRLGNTHTGLMQAELDTLRKARGVLGSLNAHREVNKKGSSLKFSDFDPKYRDEIERLYGNVDKVEYYVGVFAELPKRGLLEKIGFKANPIIGATLLDAIAKHAFRHILSNRYMTREFLNKEVMTKFGWDSLNNTSSVADLVKRNVPELGSAANDLLIGFKTP